MNDKINYNNKGNDNNIINNSDFDYEDFKKESINKLYEGKRLTGKDGIFTSMIKDFLETALKEELSNHLNDERDNKETSNNRKNGYTPKTIKTGVCDFELNTTRDRDNTFEPSSASQTALKNMIYLAIQNIRQKWNMPIQNWSLIISQLDLYFEKRLKLSLA